MPFRANLWSSGPRLRHAVVIFALAVGCMFIGLLLTDILAPWRAHAWRASILLLLALGTLGGAAWTVNRELLRRETADAALKESEARFRSLAELSADWYWEQDAHFRFTFVSGEVQDRTGTGSHEHVGRARWDIPALNLNEDDWTRHRAQLERREPFRDFEICRADSGGRLHWVATSGEPIFAADGTFDGYRGIGSDITGRKLAEEALAASEARFRAVFERSNAGIAMWGLDGRFLAANAAYCDFVGHAADELVGKMSAGDLRQPGEDEGLDLTGRMLRGEISHITRDRRYRRRDASTAWGRTTVAAVKGKDGTPQYFVAVVIDISEARAARERIEGINAELDQRVQERTAKLHSAVARLEEANRELDSFNLSVAHDLRQPLNAISGFSGLLKENAALPVDAVEFAREIETNAYRMEQMIEALLRFSGTGRGELKRVEVDMRCAVDAVLRNFESAAPLRAQIIIGELPSVRGDEALLRHVWSNLIGNALKYSGRSPAPRIEIGCSRHNGTLEYSVRDNGIGFDMRYAEKLFGVFERLPGSADYEGTGIGLAIVRRIVRRHGGQTSAESAPRRGATFRFTLPA